MNWKTELKEKLEKELGEDLYTESHGNVIIHMGKAQYIKYRIWFSEKIRIYNKRKKEVENWGYDASKLAPPITKEEFRGFAQALSRELKNAYR